MFFIINMTTNEIKGNKAPATNGMQAEKMSSQSAVALRRTVSILQYYFLIVDFLVVRTHIFTGQFFQHFYFLVIVHLCYNAFDQVIKMVICYTGTTFKR